jgi:hypothetical protein
MLMVEEKKFSLIMYNDIAPVVLIEYLKLRLSAFVVHNFIAHCPLARKRIETIYEAHN